MVVDLSQLKNKPQDEVPKYEDLTDEQKAQVDAMAAQAAESDPGLKVRTAFLVIVEEDGGVSPMVDLNFKVDRRWLPTPNDIVSASAMLHDSILMQSTAQTAAQMTVGGMQQMAMAAQQFQQEQQLKNQLGALKH